MSFVKVKMKAIPIVDVFYYDGEPIAEMRLEHLDEAVDMFVMISDKSPLSSVIEPYQQKVKIVSSFADAITAVQESFMDFIMIVSRVHEIPSMDVVQHLSARYFGLQHPMGLQMQVFYDNFSHIAEGMYTTRPYCINDVGVAHANFDARCDTRYIPTAGWSVEQGANIGVATTISSCDHLPKNIQAFNEKLVFLQRYMSKK